MNKLSPEAANLLLCLANIADEENMRVTTTQSGKGALICGAGGFIGGLCAGPMGIAIGGAIGSICAMKMVSNFKSVGAVIRNDLTAEQKQSLIQAIVDAVRNLNVIDLLSVVALITKLTSVRMTALQIISKFVTKNLKLSMVN